jgi:hypothetical protein
MKTTSKQLNLPARSQTTVTTMICIAAVTTMITTIITMMITIMGPGPLNT